MNWVGLRALVCLLSLSFALTTSFSPQASYASCADDVARGKVPRQLSTFGFEVEYVLGENPGLWEFYRPTAVAEEDWSAKSSEEQITWTTENAKVLAPKFREPAALVRRPAAPQTLPEQLIMDETGNWEIVGPIVANYDELEAQMKALEKVVGPGSYQAHVVRPMKALTRGAAGYTLFSADLLTLRKLDSQYTRHLKDPKQIPGAFFLHPFLSVYTTLKKEMLLAVTEANLKGKTWETVIPEFQARYPELKDIWKEDRPYYKYTLANTYRTDIYGNQPGKLIRWGFEVRSAHKSLEALLREVRTIDGLMSTKFDGFESFLNLQVTDPAQTEKVFSRRIQTMLQQVIPVGEEEDPRWRYFAFLHRPFEQYADLLGLSEEEAISLRKRVLKSRTEAVQALDALSASHAAGAHESEYFKNQALIVLAKFAKEMGLLPYMEQFQEQKLAQHQQIATDAR